MHPLYICLYYIHVYENSTYRVRTSIFEIDSKQETDLTCLTFHVDFSLRHGLDDALVPGSAGVDDLAGLADRRRSMLSGEGLVASSAHVNRMSRT